MEFGLDQLRIDLRPGSSRFELSRHVEIARICSKLLADRFEAKFLYAIWFESGSKLVADLQRPEFGYHLARLQRASTS